LKPYLDNFRFYEELNVFVGRDHYKQTIAYRFGGQPAIKDPIEVLGVPHSEVDLIPVNNESVGFDYKLQDGDRVADLTLHVGIHRNLRPRCGIVIDVKAPTLRELVLAGSGDVTATGIWGEDFHANIAGSGDMALGGHVDNVELKIAGSGDIDAAGRNTKPVNRS